MSLAFCAARGSRSGHAQRRAAPPPTPWTPVGVFDLGVRLMATEHDWTDGGIALSNADMAEIWRLTPDGIPIDNLP